MLFNNLLLLVVSAPIETSAKQNFRLSHSVGNLIQAKSMVRPQTADLSFASRAPYDCREYFDDMTFVAQPSIPKTHMPHAALCQQVKRGWKNDHYVREMTVYNGRDEMKYLQWNDISP